METEEFFVITHANDPTKGLVYAPLHSYLGVLPYEACKVLERNTSSNLKTSFLEMLRARLRIDMQEITENLHKASPELSLAITDNCNLRCVYCHASAGEPHKSATMHKDVIRAVLDAYFKFVRDEKNISVNFNGGGEPTYAFNEMVFAVDHSRQLANKYGKSVGFTMATNGCYGNHIREFIINNFRSVSLSFDGPQFIQNRHRPTRSGTGSFSQVFRTAKYFQNHKFPFAFRATVSSFSLPHLHEIIDLIAKEFPGKGIGLEHLNPFGRGEHSLDPLVQPPDKTAFSEAIAQLLDYAAERNVNVMNAATTEYNILRPVFCSNVGIPNWTVTTKGKIIACGRDHAPDEFVFGQFNESSLEILLDATKIAHLHKMNVLEYEECQTCFCKYHCAGDCPDRRLADKSDCNSIRRITQQVLTRLADGQLQPQPGVTEIGNHN